MLGTVAAWRLARAFQLDRGPAALAAGLMAASPVVLGQLHSHYIDGQLAAVLLALLSALLAWWREGRRADLLGAIAAAVLAANLKFSGAVYATMALLPMLALGAWRGPRPPAGLLVVTAALAALISAQPYLFNVTQHGHPFYPADRQALLTGQMPEPFLAQGRLEKLARSLLSNPGSNPTDSAALRPWPAPWTMGTLALSPNRMLNAYGGLFVWSLLIAALAVLLALRRAVAESKTEGQPLRLAFAAITLWIAASSLANPELWKLRYVPQLWLWPVLAGVWLWSVGRRAWAVACWAPQCLTVLAMLPLWWGDTLKTQPTRRLAFMQASARGPLAVEVPQARDTWFYALDAHARERGSRLLAVPAERCVPAGMWGQVRRCTDPAGPAARVQTP